MFDLEYVPFSRFGAYMAISYMRSSGDRKEGLYLRSVHGQSGTRELLRLVSADESPVSTEYASTLLKLKYSGSAEIIFPEEHCIRIRGKGTGLRMISAPFSHKHIIQLDETRMVVNLAVQYFQLGIKMLKGKVSAEHDWDGHVTFNIAVEFEPDENGEWECELTDYSNTYYSVKEKFEYFDILAERVKAEFELFYHNMPAVPEEYEPQRFLASYINWSSVVAPLGIMKRYGMFMSKNWMCNVWSWDHCFNTMALTGGEPKLAWDQFMQMFDHQDEWGAVPDTINDGMLVRLNVKPPIHGWTLLKMMERMILTTSQKEEAYDRIAKWTNWWMNMRAGYNGMPYYYHGNDSGWDNSTCYVPVMPLSSADLPAYLIIQMRALARLADFLGKLNEADMWNKRADQLKTDLVKNYWDGSELCTLDINGNKHKSKSLLPMMTIILGDELPDEIREYVVGNILRSAEQGGFMTEWGVMTEQLNSELYVSDGYWRGPIWAPSTLIIVDGLKRAGYAEEARSLALRFAKLCQKGCFAENFDAVTGQGLRDRAYTWTASTFLVLMRDYLE